MYSVGAFRSWAQTLQQSAHQLLQNPSLPSCWQLDTQAPEVAAPLQLLVQTISLVCTSAHAHTCAHTCTDTQSWSVFPMSHS